MFNTKKTWTNSFTSIMNLLRLCVNIIPTNTNSFRLFSDLEIPLWTPTLPQDIKCIILDEKTNIDGEWIYPSSIKTKFYKHSKYIYYIHGGSFCMCKPGTYRGLLFTMAKNTNCIILSINYRRSPEYKFPIPLHDCIKGYMYLLGKVKNSEKIILAGDSAGGNIAINMIAILLRQNIPIPSKCILISPWTDLTDCGINQSWIRNNKYDFVTPQLAKYFSMQYIDTLKNNLIDVSPLYLDDKILSKFPEVLVEYGQCEVLRDQIEQFCLKLKKLGVHICFNCRRDMTHVFPLFHFTGIPQSEDFFFSIKQFIGMHLET